MASRPSVQPSLLIAARFGCKVWLQGLAARFGCKVLAARLAVGLTWFAQLPAQQVEPADQQDKYCANSQQKDLRRRSAMVIRLLISGCHRPPPYQ
jgi:hypothetical protein